jgi:two-component system, OmpR family, copper resistance phosphate regulon response regulator CusR
MRLLVAEADRSLAETLQTRFQQEHFSVRVVSDCGQFAALADSAFFDLALLDANVSGPADNDALRLLQSRWPGTPVILISSDASPEDRASALNAGADDFVMKPFDFTELVARIRAVVRRQNRPIRDVFVFEDLEINRISHEVRRAGRAIELSPKEYALLEYLLRNPGTPIARTSIVEEVWRMQGDTLTNVVDVYINYLRRKIDTGSDRPLIRTIRGVGYQIGGNHHSR